MDQGEIKRQKTTLGQVVSLLSRFSNMFHLTKRWPNSRQHWSVAPKMCSASVWCSWLFFWPMHSWVTFSSDRKWLITEHLAYRCKSPHDCRMWTENIERLVSLSFGSSWAISIFRVSQTRWYSPVRSCSVIQLAILTAHRILGPIFFLTYVFFVFFVLLNMFLAIINDTYSAVKSDMTTQKSEFELTAYFKKSYDKMLDRLNVRRHVGEILDHLNTSVSISLSLANHRHSQCIEKRWYQPRRCDPSETKQQLDFAADRADVSDLVFRMASRFESSWLHRCGNWESLLSLRCQWRSNASWCWNEPHSNWSDCRRKHSR